MKKNNTSKAIIYLLVLVVLVGIGFYLKGRNNTTTTIPSPLPETPLEETPEQVPALSIRTENIKEENFSGTRPVIAGDTTVVKKAQEYVENSVAEFKKEADTDVPDMREKFGADSPTANYTIDISAKEVKGSKTQSIVLSEYTYTGGANGNSAYKVITGDSRGAKILSLGDVIKKDKRAALTDLVKKELKAWRPEGSDAPVVFDEEVKNLTFDSFTSWSLDNKNLTIYFDKYEIGPGVLGAVAFPLKLDKIKDYLEPGYQ